VGNAAVLSGGSPGEDITRPARPAQHGPQTRLVPEEVRFVSGDGEECAGTLYRPVAASSGRIPCVVMANGGSMTRRDGTPRFAERFADSGVATLAFDPRHLGDSDGLPRQLIDYNQYRADLAAAVRFSRSIDAIDAGRVAVWGFSLGGGIALATAIEDRSIAAAVLLCPMVDGLAFALAGDARNNRRLFAAALRALTRRERPRLPLTGPPGTTVLFPQEEAAAGFEAVKGESSLWENEIRFKPTQPVARFRPERRARRARCPLLVCLGRDDTIVPPGPIERTASRAPAGELRRYPINHFSAFLDGFEAVASDQVAFLSRHLA
jgi:alpha-beta hydrolase superfamily lysophospholipase